MFYLEIMIDEALKKRLRDKMEETYVKLERHFGRTFPRCKGNFDVNSVRVAGNASYSENVIRVNPAYLKAHTEHVVNGTVPHEVCHLVARIMYPHMKQNHGWEWKACMVIVGLRPDTYHSLGRVKRHDIDEFI